ncbi:motile sperm domain-containing protein 2-like isoform X2 [Cylas formicarius]|uniref:motile sperm domain-containing protein 2-like isoform X2 n=1 Tax=Cylas formicarius TaxID=197179 RepID=UPI002958993C|nr:motile sperm domain-containing protein 2-like isoform X2 [Cylas formicarius]
MAHEVPQGLVDELRSVFLKELSEKGTDAVHPKDLERFKNEDHWLQRFIAHNDNDIPLALKMVWGSLTWRKENNVNEISEKNIKMDIIIKGSFFPHGRDIDGKTIFIFKAKLHQKGTVNMDDLKRCVVYWFERLERYIFVNFLIVYVLWSFRTGKGEPISIFFDMDGCGLSNMDMEFIKYLIGLFKEYYPYFLSYILIFEMAWVLSAAFKVIKSWLPEKAVQRIRFISKKDIDTYVPLKEALRCWGGENDYVFSFIPEEPVKTVVHETNSNKKVHFVDGSPMSEASSNHTAADKEDGPLRVNPSGIITFVEESNELISTLELRNGDPSLHLSFKLKTTSPEKFRVKPSTGCLPPGGHVKVTVTLLPGFQLGGLSKDKFLVMSTVIEDKDTSSPDVSEIWKNTANRKVYQHRLKCVQGGDIAKNGSVVHHSVHAAEDEAFAKLSASLNRIAAAQEELGASVKRTQHMQLALLIWTVILGLFIINIFNKQADIGSDHSYCEVPRGP